MQDSSLPAQTAQTAQNPLLEKREKREKVTSSASGASGASASASSASSASSAERVTVKQWRCDVCKEASFADFDDACRHEESCTGPTQTKTLECGLLVRAVTVATPAAAPLVSSNNDTDTDNDNDNDTAGESRQEATKPKTTKQMKVTRDVSPDPSPTAATKKSRKAPSEASTEKPKTAPKPAHSFFAPRKTVAKLKRPTATSQAPAAFFRPGKKTKQTPKASTTTEDGDVVMDEEVQLVVGHPKQKQKQKQKPAKPQSAKSKSGAVNTKSLEKSCKALVDAIDAHTNTNTNTQSTSAPLAGIFSNKSMQQLIAEQRQAEFQAKRRAERQKELERLEKRAAAARSTTAPSTTSSSQPKAAQPLPAHCRLPLAPRFPAPSHVMSPPLEAPTTVARDDACHWLDIPHEPLAQVPSSVSSQEQLLSDDNRIGKLISSPSDLDASEDNRDLLQEAFSDLFTQPQQRQSTNREDNTSSSPLWSHKYGHQDSIHKIVGEHTKQAAETLQEWIEDWCAARHRALDRMKERQKQLKKKKKTKKAKTVYRDDSEDEGWGDEDHLANIYLLTGPPASGKTGLVHAVAKACHCSVLEINTTAVRSASSLKHSIQEATQSCSTSDLFQNQREQKHSLMKTMLQQQENALKDSEDEHDEDDDSDDEEASPKRKARPTASLTIILIDEVDLIFEAEGDAGFWTALSSLAKTARCPILLTANRVPPGMASINHLPMALSRPSPIECSNKVLQVCQQEGIAMRSGLGPEAIRERLTWIATVCGCDLRKVLLQLQLFHNTHPSVRKGASSPQMAAPNIESPEGITTVSSAPKDLRRPMLHSIVPHRVPADKYSIITIHGARFISLLTASSHDISVQLGEQSCRARVMDDETILALCPPCSPSEERPSRRIMTFSMPSTSFGKLDGVSVKAETLPDESVLLGSTRLYVEYLFLDEDTEDDDDSEEREFGESPTENQGARAVAPTSLPTLDQGLELWNKTLAEEIPASDDSERPSLAVVSTDGTAVKQLDEMSLGAQYSSDAACLEDFQKGYPLLSGACRGFGFDLTEEGGSTGGGKLRLNDNCRPPSEDRLYSLGWKDNCFFHGTPETYMVRPASARERRSLNCWMEESRGELSSTLHIATGANADKDEDSSDDLEDIILREERIPEEDIFLSQPLPILLGSLPHLLHSAHNSVAYTRNWVSNQFFEKRRQAKSIRMQTWLSNFFDRSQFSKAKGRPTSRELLLLNDNLDCVAVTDFLPILCRMGGLEESFEALERQSNEMTTETSRRTTRRQMRNGRRHYFSTLSFKLQYDEANMSTSELGRSMATALLTYQGATSTRAAS